MSKHNVFIRMLRVVLVVCLLVAFSTSASAYTYSKKDAVQYADQYALNPNENAYRTFSGDCANYVSQCLYAGGIPQDDVWFYKNGYIAGVGYTAAWAQARALKNYLKDNLGATRLVSKWTNDGRGSSYAYINNSANLTGAGNEVIFYDWEDDGYIDHAAICVAVGYPYDGPYFFGDLVNQHTNNRKHVIWHLDYFNIERASTAIYAFGV